MTAVPIVLRVRLILLVLLASIHFGNYAHTRR